MHDTTKIDVARHRTGQALALIAAVLAVIFIFSFTSLAAAARAASLPSSPSAVGTADAPAPKKLVIVVGPVGYDTADFRSKANAIATAATAHGMDVYMIYSPNATWSAVTAVANGADLFIYLGHGNGWPSPYPPFQEDGKDGIGLNPSAGGGDTTTKYYGANFFRGGVHCSTGPDGPGCTQTKNYGAGIHLAPNAIVILNHLCYSGGNGEPGMTIPTQDIAVQRVENMASGYIDAGAAVVFALMIQPVEDIINTLATGHTTMDGVFMTSYGSNRDGSYKGYYGWVGSKPNVYVDSTRAPGARIHLDPDNPIVGNYPGTSFNTGYERAITGNLTLTTDMWRSGADSGDTTPPVVTGLTGTQASNTIPADTSSPPVFTPNGDGTSDTLTINHTLSEPAYLDVTIQKPDNTVVRQYTTWSDQGATTESWNGKNTAGNVVPDGAYDITVTPKDAAGNVGAAKTTRVKVLTAIKMPTATPNMLFASDGDTLAQTVVGKVDVTKAASLTWRITDLQGNVIRIGLNDVPADPGITTWAWDGNDDTGAAVPEGAYWSTVTAVTANGAYSHRVQVRVGPFKVTANRWNATVGQSIKLTILTAEPQTGWPKVYIKQPGLAKYSLYLSRWSSKKFTTSFTMKAGGTPGTVVITVVGTDTGGGVVKRTYNATLQ